MNNLLLGWALALCFAASFASWLPCDVVSNFFYQVLCDESLGRGLHVALIEDYCHSFGSLQSEFIVYNHAAVLRWLRNMSEKLVRVRLLLVVPRPYGKHVSPIQAHSQPGLFNSMC